MNKTHYVDVADLHEQIAIIHMMEGYMAVTPREADYLDGLYELLEAIAKDVEAYDSVILLQSEDWLDKPEKE